MRGKMDLTARFAGSLIGCAVGDAIGEMAFRLPDERSLRAAIAAAEQLVYTDDTAMTIGLAETLCSVGGFDEEHLGRRFHENYKREPWRGYGPGPPALFAMVEAEEITYADAARRLYGGEGSFGNGAAMRVAPIGLAYRDSPDLYDVSCRSAAVTHAHPVGQDGAAIQALAVAEASKLDSAAPFPLSDFCARLVAAARTREFNDKMTLITRMADEGTVPAEAAQRIGRSIAVHESMPFAVYAFLTAPMSFEACLFCAVLNGGDRDTLGAMACAISGAYLGIEAIPAEWRWKLENRVYIESLAAKLAEL